MGYTTNTTSIHSKSVESNPHPSLQEHHTDTTPTTSTQHTAIMVRADGQVTKVHYKGQEGDKSKPLVDVVDSFDVFVTDGHGTQGMLNRASKAQLENEFGSKNSEDAVQQILEKGEVQDTQAKAKQGGRNESNGIGASTGTSVHN